jgi:type IV fimbrial biogenesis protein FimT
MLTSRRQRGFNIIEAAVTLTILGLLIAAVLPSASEWIRNTTVRTMAESIQNGMKKAKAEALRRNKIVTFWLVTPPTAASLDSTCALSSTSGSWVISTADPTGKCDVAPSPTVDPGIVETYGAGPGASAVSVVGLASDGVTPATFVSFNGYGQRVQTGNPLARIDLTHSQSGARRLQIEISAGGSIRMCDRDVAAGDPRACVTP